MFIIGPEKNDSLVQVGRTDVYNNIVHYLTLEFEGRRGKGEVIMIFSCQLQSSAV